MSVAGVVLAAGRSERMGTPKALVELEGSTYLVRIANTARAGGAGGVVVVRLGPAAAAGGELDLAERHLGRGDRDGGSTAADNEVGARAPRRT